MAMVISDLLGDFFRGCSPLPQPHPCLATDLNKMYSIPNQLLDINNTSVLQHELVWGMDNASSHPISCLPNWEIVVKQPLQFGMCGYRPSNLTANIHLNSDWETFLTTILIDKWHNCAIYFHLTSTECPSCNIP